MSVLMYCFYTARFLISESILHLYHKYSLIIRYNQNIPLEDIVEIKETQNTSSAFNVNTLLMIN